MFKFNDYISNESFEELHWWEAQRYLETLPTVHEYALCASRHPMPDFLDGNIFPTEVNPLDVSAMIHMAENAIPEDCKYLMVYVTGLTAAMLAVVKVCADRGISLTAMHYNRDTGDYYPQVVLGEKFPDRNDLGNGVIQMRGC